MTGRSLKIASLTVGLVLLACLLRVPFLAEEPINDELYHILAADGWRTTGEFSIGDGEYTRASLFTAALATFTSISSTSVAGHRTFSLLGGIATLLLLLFWLGRRVDWVAGGVAATLLAFSPYALFIDTYIRFYSWHTFFFLGATVCAFAMAAPAVALARRALWASGSLACLAVATLLQVTTAIGLGAIGLGLAIVLLWDIRSTLTPVRVAIGLVGTLILMCTILFVADLTGLLDFALDQYLGAALWSSTTSPFYYFRSLSYWYPSLLVILPLAIFVASGAQLRLTLFLATIFVVIIAVHSFAGMKAERFVHYAMPALFAIIGIAASAVVEKARSILASRGDDHLRVRLLGAAVVATFALAVVSNPGLSAPLRVVANKTLKDYRGQPTHWYRYNTQWQDLVGELKSASLLMDSTKIITSQGLHALYFLGRYDYELNRARWLESELQQGLVAEDHRTGKPVVQNLAGLRHILNCDNDAIVIIDALSWRSSDYVDLEVSEYIETTLAPSELGTGGNFHVFHWRTDDQCLN